MQARWLLRYVPIQMAGVMGLAPNSSTVTEWIPRKLAPGAGVAPTPAASKAVELLLFDPGMVGRQGLAP
jgi:hypothetical protein